jgi:exonuclease SbcD
MGLTVMETRSGPLQVVGVPWPSISQMLTRDELRNLPMDRVDREIEQRIASGIDTYAEQLDPTLPAILTAHIAMSDSIVKTASEKFMTIGRFPQLNRSDLRPDAFDYVALGHHHCYQMLHPHPPMVYAGSMQRVDFGEEGDDKGFVIVHLDPAKPRGERVQSQDVVFRKVKARRFVTIEVRPRQEDPTSEVLDAIAKKDVHDAVVRVLLTLTPSQNSHLDERAVRAALSDAHVIASVSRTVERGVRARLGRDLPLEALTPLEALRLHLENTKVPPDRRAVLLEYARPIIEGAEPSVER